MLTIKYPGCQLLNLPSVTDDGLYGNDILELIVWVRECDDVWSPGSNDRFSPSTDSLPLVYVPL